MLPALTLHEAVPGHHLQAAIAAEKADLPMFRRHAYFDVTGEGWGLYAEKLGDEMRIYTTPYERFGRLTYEMWRACRLAYKIGELAILELRARAERSLGPRFDIRRFHDVLLAGGSLPLGALEDQVTRYIAEELAAAPAADPARRR